MRKKLSSHNRLMLLVVGIMLLLAMPSMIVGQVGSSSSASGAAGTYWVDFWLVRLILNVLGYATIVIPGAIIIYYVRKTKYLTSAGSGCLPNILRICINGSVEGDKVNLDEGSSSTESQDKADVPFSKRVVQLLWCSGGLLCSYLVWGVLQERIMSYKYGATDTNEGEHFKNSQFIVFMNRILAFVIGTIVVLVRPQPKHRAPVYKYSYSSFSNIMSSWCQYEALKFVSFPTQVLAKASKVIPVMLMGKVVSRKSYDYHEYITALMISIGVSMFVLTSKDTVHDRNTVTTVSGVVILCCYLGFDAFTSNWQGELYKQYKVSSIQMMLGVNLFSVLFTCTTLLQQSSFFEAFAFMSKHPTFTFHIIILSITSATGQLFIFHTIDVFGPVTFTIIMTIRQGISILLSCIIYGHPVTVTGVLGILFIFIAIFSRIYMNYSRKKKKLHGPIISTSSERTVSISLPTSEKA